MTLSRCPLSIVCSRGTPPIGFGDSGARVGACMGRELYSRLGLLVREVGSNPPRNFDCFQGGSRKHLRARLKDGSRHFFNPHNKCLGLWRFPAVWSYGLFAYERLRGLILPPWLTLPIHPATLRGSYVPQEYPHHSKHYRDYP